MLLIDKINSKVSIVLHTTAIRSLTKKQKREKALKLHRQFSHASKEKLSRLVKESKDFSDND